MMQHDRNIHGSMEIIVCLSKISPVPGDSLPAVAPPSSNEATQLRPQTGMPNAIMFVDAHSIISVAGEEHTANAIDIDEAPRPTR